MYDLISNRRSNLVFVNRNKRNRHLTDFTVPAHHGVKVKQSKAKKWMNTKTLLESGEKLWSMKVTVIPIMTEILEIEPGQKDRKN